MLCSDKNDLHVSPLDQVCDVKCKPSFDTVCGSPLPLPLEYFPRTDRPKARWEGPEVQSLSTVSLANR